MSLTIFQQPLGLTPSNAYHIYNVGSTLSGSTDFRYIAEVWIDPFTTNAVKAARLKVQPNTTGRGIFNVEEIVRSYVKPNVRSEDYQHNNGSTITQADWGFIPNNQYFGFHNAYNDNNLYETQRHITEYRVILGEQYYSGGTWVDTTPTLPYLPVSTFSATTANFATAFSGSPIGATWINAGENLRPYGVSQLSGVSYLHTTSVGGFVESGTTSTTSGNFNPSNQPLYGDFLYITERYSGIIYTFRWGLEVSPDGWVLASITRPDNAANPIQQPEDITTWPAAQWNTNNWQITGNTSESTRNPDGIYNFQYNQAYQFQTLPYSARTSFLPSRFMTIFGDDTKTFRMNSIASGATIMDFPVRYRRHHYQCPSLLSFMISKNQLFTPTPTRAIMGLYNDVDTTTKLGSIVGTENWSTLSGTTTYFDPKYRIEYYNPRLAYQAEWLAGIKEVYYVGLGAGYSPLLFNITGNSTTEIVKLELYGDECLSTPIHFVFLNSNGVWDTYTFDRKNVKKLTNAKKTYAQGGIRDNGIFNPFDYTPRKVNYDSDLIESVMAMSDWVSPNDVPIIEDMFKSTQVYLYKDGDIDNSSSNTPLPYLIPIYITDTGFEEYSGRYSKLYQYTFNFEYNPFQQYRTNL